MAPVSYTHLIRAKRSVARLIGAGEDEIVFTANGSQAIGMVAAGLRLSPGDNVIVDEMSFISNVAPFLRRKEVDGIEVRFIPAKLPGIIDLNALEHLIDKRTKMVSLCHMANNLGMVQPAEMCIRDRLRPVRFWETYPVSF